MNRLEEIRERLSYFPHELQDGGFSENSLEYGARLDIEYLLSKLEIAQKALGHVEAECTMYPANQMSIDRIVKQALDQLKEP